MLRTSCQLRAPALQLTRALKIKTQRTRSCGNSKHRFVLLFWPANAKQSAYFQICFERRRKFGKLLVFLVRKFLLLAQVIFQRQKERWGLGRGAGLHWKRHSVVESDGWDSDFMCVSCVTASLIEMSRDDTHAKQLFLFFFLFFSFFFLASRFSTTRT